MNLFDFTQIYPRFYSYHREPLGIFHGNVPKIWERFHETENIQIMRQLIHIHPIKN